MILRSAFVLCFLWNSLVAQNLINNPGFETVTAEPYYGCEITNAPGWLNPSNSACPNNSAGTPDLFSTLSTGQAILPNSFMGTTNPHTGDRICGLVTYHQQVTNYREYLTSQLSCPLIVGQTYNISFWSTGGDPVQYIYHSNNIGLYFSTAPLSQTGYDLIPGLTPQLELTNVVADNAWTYYTFVFTPTVPFTYMTVGNFRTDANTQHPSFGTNRPYAYYFFDDFSIAPVSGSFTLGNDTTYCGSFSRTLETGDPSTVWSTGVIGSQITVTAGGIYWVSVSNSCDTLSDTIIITQSIAPVVNLGNDTALCTGQNLFLDATNTNATYLWQDNSTASTYVVLVDGTYAVTVTGPTGCTVSDDIVVSYASGPPVVNIGPDTAYCGSFARVLSTGSSNTSWSTGVVGAQIIVTNAGTYWATESNGCGIGSDTVTILQNSVPVVPLGNDTTLCSGQILLLDAANGGSTYLWQDNSATQTYMVTGAGAYSVTVTNGAGCSASDDINVNYISAPPPINLGNDTTYCGSFTRTLSTGNLNTLWSTGVTASQITISTAGNYWAELSNACGTSRDSVAITKNQIPTVSLGNDTSVCGGQTLLLTPTPLSSNYLWNDGSTGSSLNISAVGVYWVEVRQTGCTNRDSILISAENIPNVNLGKDTVVCANRFDLALHIPNAQYQWQDHSTDSFYHVFYTGVYTVTVTNACGTATDVVNVDIHADECSLLIPTAFSPNADGFNDVFHSVCRCPVTRYELHIYDRWGEEVFSTNDPSEGWDGVYRNRQQPLGVYVYYIDYFNYCHQKMDKIAGNVTLVR